MLARFISDFPQAEVFWMGRRWLVISTIAVTILLAAGVLVFGYRSAMQEAHDLLAAYRPRTVATTSGELAYAETGVGPPVLMIHGSGGGYDQGSAMTEPLVARGYRVIAPSRFGYPGSTYPEDASPRAQADGFAQLLDALGIDEVVVIGGSAGAISATAFAVAFPERTTALVVIVPAIPVPGQGQVEPWSPFQERLVRAALQSDFLFWAAIRFFPGRVTEAVLATDPALIAEASPQEKSRVNAILWRILPVSARAEGLLHDTRSTAGITLDYEAIAVPTLAISAEDDLYRTAEGARHLSSVADGAELIIYPNGGHVWVGRNEELFSAIDGFIRRVTQPD